MTLQQAELIENLNSMSDFFLTMTMENYHYAAAVAYALPNNSNSAGHLAACAATVAMLANHLAIPQKALMTAYRVFHNARMRGILTINLTDILIAMI